MSIDSIGNFLTILRNGIMVSKLVVAARHSKMNVEISKILQQEGFINGYEILEADGHKTIKVSLRYVDNESVIHALERVSKPSRRVYTTSKNIKPVVGGLGISILSTNRGVMTSKQAREESVNLGGEIICKVW
jgi:small subunit ribosomal protein S8